MAGYCYQARNFLYIQTQSKVYAGLERTKQELETSRLVKRKIKDKRIML